MLKSKMSDLCDLPDELLVRIVNNFHSIRSYEPQSVAFKNRKKERTRQHENRICQMTLFSLSLTSRRWRAISTPILYASFLSTTTWHSLTPLAHFHRTISVPGNGYGLNIRLADCLTYIENRFADHLGNSLEQDSEFPSSTSLVGWHFFLLSEIVTYAKNLQHLSVVSIESHEVSFWSNVIPLGTGLHGTKVPTKVDKHLFPKLQTLCVQIHDQERVSNRIIENSQFHRICHILEDLPLLSEFRASDMPARLSLTAPLGEWKTLRRLELTKCCSRLKYIANLLIACQSLRHFTCVWEYCHDNDVALSDLYSGLLKHERCLKNLVLDTREVRFICPSGSLPQPLGSLRSFMALESLVICETSLLSSNSQYLMVPEQFHDRCIADLLPESLKDLKLLIKTDGSIRIDSMDEASALWQIVQSCATVLPRLRIVNIEGSRALNATALQAAFSDIGVQLNTLVQAW